ncbi:hypothetical protein, partial [Pseudomonas aeruginosa]|uniref:hypothetical protein n=1 Tax=Pseudomonas aeruginosa TaxID=287 RepID=UPI001C4EE9F8
MSDITPNTAVNQPQAFNLQAAADRVCSLISASPIERGDQLEAFVSEPTRHAQISYAVFRLKKKTLTNDSSSNHSLTILPQY